MVFNYNGILFTLKKEGISDPCSAWMSLEDMPSESSQTPKDKCCMSPLTGGMWDDQRHETKSRTVATRAGGRDEWGASVRRVWSVWNALEERGNDG